MGNEYGAKSTTAEPFSPKTDRYCLSTGAFQAKYRYRYGWVRDFRSCMLCR